MRKADLSAGLVLVLFGVVMMVWVIPAQTQHVREISLQPSFYPNLAAGALVFFAVLLVIQAIARRDRGGEEAPLLLRNWVSLVLVAGIMFAALAAFDYLGFLVGGIALVLVLMLYMGARSIPLLASVSIGTPVAIWLFFEVLLERPLP